jgi:hypothetical protein
VWVVVVAVIGLAGFLISRLLLSGALDGGSPPPGPVAGRSAEGTEGNFADLVAVDSEERRAGARAPSTEQVAGESQALVDEQERAPDARHEAWALVARLEELARTPRTFHALALPVVDRMTAVCSKESAPGQSRSASGSPEVVVELQREVVADPQRNALVRGAVFLALAPLLPESEFWGTFTEWTSGHADVPLELVRAAALAAARTGSPAPCKFALPLTKLTALPTLGAPDLPGFYPLALDRIASGRACDAIRRWLDIDDPRRSLFRLGSGAPPGGAKLDEAGEYFVTVEILFCVWGHRSLEDTLVERAVLAETRFDPREVARRSLVSLRVAHFLVMALARCNPNYFDAAVAMTSVADSPLSDMLGELQRVLSEELGLATLERLERLRYSEKPSDRVNFTLALAALRDEFLRGETHDPEQRTLLLEYLCGLVADPGLSSMVRMNAIHAVAVGGSWEALLESAAASFLPGAPLDLAALALEPLLAAARSNPARRSEALALLRRFSAQAPANASKLGVESYIAELTQ